MKKSALVAGATIAVAISFTMTGCKADKPRRSRTDKPAVVQVQPQQQTDVIDVPPPPPPPVDDGFTVEPLPPAPPQPVDEVKPLPPPPPPPPPKAETFDYVIKSGDALDRVARRFKTTTKAILAANPSIKDANAIQAGKKIKIPAVDGVTPPPPPPPPGPNANGATPPPPPPPVADYTGPTQEYVVQSGDTLSGIAFKWGLTMLQLKKLNGIAPGPATNGIRIGQKLKVPTEKQQRPGPQANVQQPKPQPKPAPGPDVKKDDGKKSDDAKKADAEKKADDDKGAKDDTVVEPEPQPEPEPEPAKPEGRFHVVVDGEDIVTIAINYEVSPSQIVELNGDIVSTAADPVEPGTKLRLPPNAK